MTSRLRSLIVALLTVALFSPLAFVRGQEAPDKAPENAPGKAKADQVSFPFTFEGLLFVQAKVNNKGPYKFLFDSGASQSVLNQRLSKELDLKEHEMPGGAVQGVGSAEASLVILDSIEIGGFRKAKTVCASMNFDHMSGGLGFHMMGIVGQNVLKMMKVIEIDFATSQMTVTRFGADEVPTDMDEMLAQALEGGGMPGLPDIPGFPGFPGPGREEGPKEAPKPGPRKEEEFSVPHGAPWGAWLLQDDGGKQAAKPMPQPTENMSLTWNKLQIPMVGGMLDNILPTFWNLKCKANGKEKLFMFDTGASMLLALSTGTAKDLKVETSFSFPVKGIGKNEATEGLLDSYTIGNLELSDVPCTILELPSIIEQLPEGVRDILRMILQATDNKLDFDGIVGLPLALRYKKLVVTTKTRNIEFVAWGKDEVNPLNPVETEDFFRDAVIRTWNGKAGKVAFKGDSVPLDDWKKHGLEDGGLMVEEVIADSEAHKAGLRKGDIITHLVGEAGLPPMEDAKPADNDIAVRDMPALVIWACSRDPGSEAKLRVRRGDEKLELKLKLENYGWQGTVPERHKLKE